MFRLRNVILLWLGRRAWNLGRSAWRRRQAGRAARPR